MKKRVVICVGLLLAAMMLSGCSVDIDGTRLEGINVLWTPFVAVWKWLWENFTPGFWVMVDQAWTLPAEISWLAGSIAYILGFVLYAVIALIILVIDIVIGIITGLIIFILGIINGFAHFI